MFINIQNSITNEMIKLEVQDFDIIQEIIDGLIESGFIKDPNLNYSLILMGRPLSGLSSIQDAREKYGLRDMNLLVLMEVKKASPKVASADIIQEPNEEEDIFNQLMESGSSREEPPEIISAPEPLGKPEPRPAPAPKPVQITRAHSIEKTPITKIKSPTLSENPEELLAEHGAWIKKRLAYVSDKEAFLSNLLGDSYKRIRGAMEQFNAGEISVEDMIKVGVYVLKHEFIDLFLGAPKKPKPVREEIKEPEEPDEKTTSLEPSGPEKPQVKIPMGLFSGMTETSEDETKLESKAPLQAPIKPIKIERSISQSQPQSKEPEPIKRDFKVDLIDKPLPAPEPVDWSEPSSPIVKKPFKIESVQPVSRTRKVSEVDLFTNGPNVAPRKIESVAPEKKVRSRLEAIKQIGSAIEKVKLEPLEFDSVDDAELKMVNVGATLPGTFFFDQFGEIWDLIHDMNYDRATRKLKDLIAITKKRNDPQSVEKAEDILANMSVFKMIPVLIDAGDNVIGDVRKANEKFKKALGFAKLTKDDHYIREIEKRLTSVRERVVFKLKKEEIVVEADMKVKNLVKSNIRALGKKESLMSLVQIKKYCQMTTKSDEYITSILIEMIEKKEIYAKFFPQSKKVMFDKESNQLFSHGFI